MDETYRNQEGEIIAGDEEVPTVSNVVELKVQDSQIHYQVMQSV